MAVRLIVEVIYEVIIMNKDQVKDRIKETEGNVKAVSGEIDGNKRQKKLGKIEKNFGKTQANYGLENDRKKAH